MSREPKMDEATYQTLLARFATAGYDRQSSRSPQFPDQVGQPGFSDHDFALRFPDCNWRTVHKVDRRLTITRSVG